MPGGDAGVHDFRQGDAGLGLFLGLLVPGWGCGGLLAACSMYRRWCLEFLLGKVHEELGRVAEVVEAEEVDAAKKGSAPVSPGATGL